MFQALFTGCHEAQKVRFCLPNLADRHCLKWASFSMGPYEQNQHFAELRQKICLYKHAVVLLLPLTTSGLPSLDGIKELFVGKSC